MIEVRNLSKFYGEKRAIDSLHFQLQMGEVVGLLGLNGAGKTTTIRILTGSLTPSSGEARINGKSVFDNPTETKKLIGYLPENPPLYEDFSVVDYLLFVARLKSIPKDQITEELTRVLGKTNLVEVKDKLIYQLSLGYRKRVGIAQAILEKPKVVIMDEPISGLDPLQIIEIRNLIRSLSGEHTVLISSHILSEIYKTCDKFLFLHNGKLKKTIDLAHLEKEMIGFSKLVLTLRGNQRESQSKFLKGLLGDSAQASLEWVEETHAGHVWKLSLVSESSFKEALYQSSAQAGHFVEYIQKEEVTLEEIFMDQV